MAAIGQYGFVFILLDIIVTDRKSSMDGHDNKDLEEVIMRSSMKAKISSD